MDIKLLFKKFVSDKFQWFNGYFINFFFIVVYYKTYKYQMKYWIFSNMSPHPYIFRYKQFFNCIFFKINDILYNKTIIFYSIILKY